MAMIMLMASRRAVMGDFALTKWLALHGWLATAIMAAAAVGMFATWGKLNWLGQIGPPTAGSLVSLA